MIGIYKITNKLNGKCYIGQSTNIKKRWENHRSMNGNEDYPLYRAFRKYGVNNFKFEVLEECNKEELEHMEYFYILLFESDKNGYNQTLSTRNPLLDKNIMEKAIKNMTKNHQTKEHRLKQSKITKELWRNEKYREKVLKACSTPEAKKAMSDASKRYWKEHGEELKLKIKEALNSEEIREYRSKLQKERFKDEQYKAENKKHLQKANQIYREKMKNDKEFRKSYIEKTRKASEPKMKKISMFNKRTNEHLKTFNSLAEATRWIQDNTSFPKADYSTIRKAGKSDTRSAYGYKWKLHESVETIRKE